MDESLREELNRAFHSNARAQFVRKQLSKVTSIDETSIYEKVTDSFFSFTKSRAEGILRQKYYNIASFVSSIEKSYTLGYIKAAVNYTLELLAEYSGAVSFLWDLGAIDQAEAEEYFVFAGELKGELILFKKI
jgi:hypothetical protein